MIAEYKGKTPKIGKDVFIAPTAVIIGDVEIADGANIWYGAVLRGDMSSIRVGRNTNIQDNCTVHTDYGKSAIIGQGVTVGHNAVVHGCTVEDNCLIGISAVVLNNAVIKTGSIVAAGSVVREGQVVGPGHLVTGIPASLKKILSEEEIESLRIPAIVYTELADSARHPA
jgi:carbonic anhydrase/acetyltransferase-like protein (isoleucine patch superfamily)